MKKRIVVTGLGVISSIGCGKDEFWKNVIAGKSGISDIEFMDVSDQHTKRGGEIKNFDYKKYLKVREAFLMGRASQFAASATKMALEDANVDIDLLKKKRVCITFGTTVGEGQEVEKADFIWLKEGSSKVTIDNIRKSQVNNISTNVANVLKLNCVNRMFTTACAAGNYAVGYGIDLMLLDKVDMVIAGGSDAFSYMAFTGFNQVRAVAPEKCQPFDKNRKGMMVGEGAGVLILETLEHALKRKAHIYAELLGYGLSCDANHMTNPDADGISWCINDAIKNSKILKEEVDYICAHGTGTYFNDLSESKAINNVFGNNTKNIGVSSVKSMLGHTMGAASAIEAAVCCLAVKNDIMPPTINFETSDPECNIDCVPNKARKKKIRVALNNAFAFGGNNSCLVIKKL